MNAFKDKAVLILALMTAAGYRALLILTGAYTFNGDEAVVATMARHILQGARPVFFYGQAYMGSLDAYLLAGGFALLGQKVWVIRLVQLLLYLAWLLSVWYLADAMLSNKKMRDMLLIVMAIPSVLVSTYTGMSLGGYSEALIMGNLVLLLAYRLTQKDTKPRASLWLLIGFVGGLGFWTLGIMGPYLLTAGILGLIDFSVSKIKYYLIAGVSFFLGSLPWWCYNLQHDWAALKALGGGHIYQAGLFAKVLSIHFFSIPAVLGLRFPWRPEYLPAVISLPLLLIYLIAAGNALFRKGQFLSKFKPGAGRMLAIFTILFLASVLFSRYGIDYTGRYWLPFVLPVGVLLVNLAVDLYERRRYYAWGLLILLLGLNAAGTQLAASSPDKLTTQFDPISSFDNRHDQALIEFLREHGEFRGYTNYWVSFRIAFLSEEEILFSADLPYKADLSYNPVDNRYLAYKMEVSQSERVAYITTNHPVLDTLIRDQLAQHAIHFKEAWIGPYHIFYQLSDVLSPEEFGFGLP